MKTNRPSSKKGSTRRRVLKLFDRSAASKLGLPPGSVVPIGSHHDFTPELSLMRYGPTEFYELAQTTPDKLAKTCDQALVNWVNIEGVHDVDLVQKVSAVFDLHPLTQEDVVNTTQRPQFESYPGYFFFTLKMLYLDNERHLMAEHLSIVLKGNTIITFQETPGDVFGRIRERLRAQGSKVRTERADYLVYLLIDSIVDGYYQVVDRLAERIDSLEDELRAGPRDEQLAQMFSIRRETLYLRKNIMPVRELLGKAHVAGNVFQENTKIYLKDLTDHMQQVGDALGLAMEMTGVLIETYHSMQNQKLNAVMKTLTMISTLFLPLNFIAGIYGMNFKHMPELEWIHGYPLALGMMAFVCVAMISYFVSKGWLLERWRPRDLLRVFEIDGHQHSSHEHAHPHPHAATAPIASTPATQKPPPSH